MSNYEIVQITMSYADLDRKKGVYVGVYLQRDGVSYIDRYSGPQLITRAQSQVNNGNNTPADRAISEAKTVVMELVKYLRDTDNKGADLIKRCVISDIDKNIYDVANTHSGGAVADAAAYDNAVSAVVNHYHADELVRERCSIYLNNNQSNLGGIRDDAVLLILDGLSPAQAFEQILDAANLPQ